MDTQRLYYADPYLRQFSATVVDCQSQKHGWAVVLDRTAFYPEGGGQPADHGVLGQAAVTDVHERDGQIIHTCDQPVAVGETVACTIDWQRRFDHMQQHSGEHILSGILCADYHCDNVGFHLGAEMVTIDYNAPLTWDQVLAAEAKANCRVWADAAVEIAYPSPSELEAMEYRSKKALTGAVRIVTFPHADRCACCGTHVSRAGEVGIIKALSCQKFRDGVRIELVCGQRALTALSKAWEQNRAVGQALSVKPFDTAAAVERLEAELTAAKQRMSALEDTVFAALAAEQAGRGDVLLFQPPMRPDGVRKLADAVAQSCGGLAAVFAGADSVYHYALVRADGQDLSPLVKAMNAALQGRGGGRGGFAQGSVQATETAISAFFQS